MLEFGAMPSGRKVLARASSCWIRATAVLLLLLWLETGAAEATGGVIPFNKLEFPDLLDGSLFVLDSVCHRGDGEGAEARSRSSSLRLGMSSSPSAFVHELRRPPNPSGNGGRQPVSGLAVVFSGRKAAWYIGVCSSSSIFIPPGLMPRGRQLRISCSVSFVRAIVSCWSRRQSDGGPVAPSGMFPGGGGIVAVQRRCFGPNCDFRTCLRVLLASIRGLLVIYILLESCCALCTVYQV